MGWLFGCFGCGGGGRKETSPRLSSHSHKAREHLQTQARLSASSYATSSTTGGNSWLRTGDCLSVDRNGLQHLRIRNHDWQDVHAQETDPARVLEEEIIKLRSSGLSLQTPKEPVKDSKNPLQAPIWDSSPVYSPVSVPDKGSPGKTITETGVIPAVETAVDNSADASDLQSSLSSRATVETSPTPVLEQIPRVLVSRPSGFFMLPRKKSFACRAFWQEPLSPVAEAESSTSSEEDCNTLSESKDSIASERSRNSLPGSPFCKVPDDSKNEGSDVEIAPVRCSSPVVERKSVEANRISSKEKENLFGPKTPVDTEKRGERYSHQASVLTPVGNILQWRQLKEEAWDSNTKGRQVEAEDKDKVSPMSSGSEEQEFEPKDYSFFSELQWSSTQISTPQLRPSSRWGDDAACLPPSTWEGQGIPNSTRKYKEDQHVVWHSTPFEAQIDKALASSRQLRSSNVTAAPRATLF